eukprot:Nk52_evm1s192 gene=Nk52_evmTU1s192
MNNGKKCVREMLTRSGEESFKVEKVLMSLGKGVKVRGEEEVLEEGSEEKDAIANESTGVDDGEPTSTKSTKRELCCEEGKAKSGSMSGNKSKKCNINASNRVNRVAMNCASRFASFGRHRTGRAWPRGERIENMICCMSRIMCLQNFREIVVMFPDSAKQERWLLGGTLPNKNLSVGCTSYLNCLYVLSIDNNVYQCTLGSGMWQRMQIVGTPSSLWSRILETSAQGEIRAKGGGIVNVRASGKFLVLTWSTSNSDVALSKIKNRSLPSSQMPTVSNIKSNDSRHISPHLFHDETDSGVTSPEFSPGNAVAPPAKLYSKGDIPKPHDFPMWLKEESSLVSSSIYTILRVIDLQLNDLCLMWANCDHVVEELRFEEGHTLDFISPTVGIITGNCRQRYSTKAEYKFACFSLDLGKMKLTLISKEKDILPPKLQRYSTAKIGSKFFIIGGVVTRPNNAAQEEVSDKVYMFDTADTSLPRFYLAGILPAPRFHHRSFSLTDSIYLTGGISVGEFTNPLLLTFKDGQLDISEAARATISTSAIIPNSNVQIARHAHGHT